MIFAFSEISRIWSIFVKMLSPAELRPQRGHRAPAWHEPIYEIQRLMIWSVWRSWIVNSWWKSWKLTKSPNLHQQRRHNLQASARGNDARDMKRGPDLRSYSFVPGPSSRAQTNCQIRSTSQKGFQIVKNFEFRQKSVFPHTGITLEPGYARKALRVTWEQHLDYAAAPIWRKICHLGVEIGPALMIFVFSEISWFSTIFIKILSPAELRPRRSHRAPAWHELIYEWQRFMI